MVSRVIRCDEESIRRLLDDSLPDPERDELVEHLDTCVSCRGLLESAAATGRWWADLRRFDLDDLAGREAHPGNSPTPIGGPGPASADDQPGRDPFLPFFGPPVEPGEVGTFGPYRVLEVIGRGGMGIVLKAFDPALHRVAAVKVLAPQLAVGSAARRRFTREARAAASISHDNVVSIHAVDEAAGLPYLVMPFIAGRSLQQRIDRDGPLRPEEVARVGMQVALGLAAAHAQGLIHRDIKPSNILMENGLERVRITDFGLARTADDASLTQSGVVAGTPQYMAPEQARGEPVDHRADLFSLGSVMYAACTGRSPFRAETAMGVLRRVSEDDPRPIREVDPAVPSWLEAVVAKLLAKAPHDRFATAEEVAELLGKCLAHLQQPTRCPLPELPRARMGSRRGKDFRRPVAIATAVGLGVCAVLFGVVLRFRTPEGTLVVEVEDPRAEIRIDGDEVVIAGLGVHEVRLRAGDHQVRASRDGRAFLNQVVTIERGGKPVVTVRREAPEADARPEVADAPPAREIKGPNVVGVSPMTPPPGRRRGEPLPVLPDLVPELPDATERMAEMDLLARSFRVVAIQGQVRREAELMAGAIARWQYPSFDVGDGSLWIWGAHGRPVAAVAFELHLNAPGGPSWGHEFTSLSQGTVDVLGPPFEVGSTGLAARVARDDASLWTPRAAGLDFREVPRTPGPSEDETRRLAQMKAIAARFSTGELNGRSARLRIGPSPILRYEEAAGDLIDGAVFLVADGQNPEALLLVEAQGPSPGRATWRYGLAIMTRASITVSLDDHPVWERPYTSRPPIDAPYFNANRPRRKAPL